MNIEQSRLSLGRPTHQVGMLLAPWLSFCAFLLWGWRVEDIFHNIPSYGDVLEVLWGTLWYHDALLVKHVSPLYTPLVFHPNGWQTATLAHTPVFFLLTLPLYEVGGVAFAYNSLALLSLFVTFAGMFRFVRLFATRFSASVAALVFTFIGARWLRVGGGHLHILWASSLLPWLAWELEHIRRSSPTASVRKLMFISGLIWGVMINFSLYSIFLGGVIFSIWGRQILILRRIKQALQIAVIALIVGSPSIVLYALGNRQDPLVSFGVSHIIHWGASLNSIPAPFVFHTLDFVRQVAHSIYAGPYDESGVANLGPVTCLLGLLGLVLMLKHRKEHSHLAWLMLAGVVLSLGLFLRWDGQIVKAPIFRSFDVFIWGVGHTLKPALFTSLAPESGFRSGVPLPGFVLTAMVPFWESARVMSRYVFAGAIGMVALAAYGLQRLPKAARYLMAVIWLVEVLPGPTATLPVPMNPHPAYAWLAQQNLSPGEGIVDMEYPTIMIGGETLFSTWYHRKPTASGVGSFWPQGTKPLWEYFAVDSQALSGSESALILQQYDVRYLFLHLKGNREKEMWNRVSQNPAFRPTNCFDPLRGPSPWPYPICVAEVITPSLPINVIRREGWSGEEEWGVWSEESKSKSQWIAMSRKDHRLAIEAFPFCVPGKRQEISIKVNGQLLTTHSWEVCETWQAELVIPQSIVKVGWNDLSFEYGYTASPADITNGENPDPRQLAVGFKKLEVIR